MNKIKSIQELIEMKQSIDENRNAIRSIYIPSLDTEFKFKMATRPEMVQLRNMDAQDQDTYLIFTHVIEPNLKDSALQEAYNRGNKPYDIVDKLLNYDEVGMLSLAIIDQNSNADIVGDIKN